MTTICTTLEDVAIKYTSQECQEEFSYMLCDATMSALNGTDYDDYSVFEPTDQDLLTVNTVIQNAINNDVKNVIDRLYDEMGVYIADMTQKGVIQRLPATLVKHIRKIFQEFYKPYEKFAARPVRNVITRKPFVDDEDNEADTRINHLNKLFCLNSQLVYTQLQKLAQTMNGLTHEIHRKVTEGLLDSLIPRGNG